MFGLTRNTLRRWIATGSVVFCAFAATANARAAAEGSAAASAWARTDVTEVRLISAQSALGQGGVAALGLQFRLADKWKIYWKTPGDAGFPPVIDWSESTNLDSADIVWPAPERFVQFGDLVSNGYTGEVVLPLTVRSVDAAAPLALRAAVDYVACEEICVPMRAELTLDLPAGPAAPTVYADLVARFSARVPGPPLAGDPKVIAAEIGGTGADRLLRVIARSPVPFAAPDLFVEGPDAFTFRPPEVELREGGVEAVFRLAAPANRNGDPLVGVPLTFTLVDRSHAVEQTLAGVAGAAESFDVGALAAILGLAFLGGLILNLMPCVLPVLSLKLIGVIGMAGAARRRVVTRFAAAAAGIVVSFLLLAGLVIALKAAGLAVGWGIQFQEPLFLVALIAILTLFACNLWGFYELPLPAWLANLGGSRQHDSVPGHFLSGAFATVLATPCSAPFLGTAVGFALARGPLEIVTVFAALGLGMATPYLAVAAFPGLATRLPNPGAWMGVLRRILGVLLAATAVWLITVLAAQAGITAALVVAALMLGATLVLWGGVGRLRRLVMAAALTALIVLAFVAPGQLGRDGAPVPPAAADEIWQPFDQAAIPELLAAGKTVLVNVTADWCITCQFNQRTVLDRGAVANRLTSGQIVAMRADWTLPNPAIAAYLEGFGRFGIPFNAVYGPALPHGLPLPEILTEDAVVAAFDRAGSTLAKAK
ncbi:MAG: protein-disulfide reductase DsbD family protein [Alphaproteobacteria bacterium]